MDISKIHFECYVHDPFEAEGGKAKSLLVAFCEKYLAVFRQIPEKGLIVEMQNRYKITAITFNAAGESTDIYIDVQFSTLF